MQVKINPKAGQNEKTLNISIKPLVDFFSILLEWDTKDKAKKEIKNKKK